MRLHKFTYTPTLSQFSKKTSQDRKCDEFWNWCSVEHSVLSGVCPKMNKISLLDLKKLPVGSFYVISNGKIVKKLEELTENDKFTVCPRVFGGKGGFGSLLRSFRIYKSTNQDMCRDLSGRRMRDIKVRIIVVC